MKYKKVNTEECYYTSWRDHLKYSSNLKKAKIKINAYFNSYVPNNKYYTQSKESRIYHDVSWLICSMITAQRAAIELYKK